MDQLVLLLVKLILFLSVSLYIEKGEDVDKCRPPQKTTKDLHFLVDLNPNSKYSEDL